jgi:hypothetical protein
MTHPEKMKEAIRQAHKAGKISDEFLNELPDLDQMVKSMIVVGGVLATVGVVGSAVAATGVGAVAEAVAGIIAAAIITTLSIMGIVASVRQIKDGIVSLAQFYDDTRCDKAQTPEQLETAGENFAKGIAKAGVGTITGVLSVLGARQGLRIAGQAKATYLSAKYGGPEGQALLNAKPVGSALKEDPHHRAATWAREDAAHNGTHFPLTGNDGQVRTLTQIPGELNGEPGRFEYIVDQSGNLTHQRFVKGGSINGIPNKP